MKTVNYRSTFIYVLLVSIIFCCTGNANEPRKQNEDMFEFGIKTIEHDSCEYVLYCSKKSSSYSGAWTSGLTHKGNCKFCTERSKK